MVFPKDFWNLKSSPPSPSITQMPQGFKMARAFIISAKLRLLKSVRKAAYYGVEFFLKSHFFFTLEMHTNMD